MTIISGMQLTLRRAKNLQTILSTCAYSHLGCYTYISKSLSTSSGVTRPCTKISGGLSFSIILALIFRSFAGPKTLINYD